LSFALCIISRDTNRLRFSPDYESDYQKIKEIKFRLINLILDSNQPHAIMHWYKKYRDHIPESEKRQIEEIHSNAKLDDKYRSFMKNKRERRKRHSDLHPQAHRSRFKALYLIKTL